MMGASAHGTSLSRAAVGTLLPSVVVARRAAEVEAEAAAAAAAAAAVQAAVDAAAAAAAEAAAAEAAASAQQARGRRASLAASMGACEGEIGLADDDADEDDDGDVEHVSFSFQDGNDGDAAWGSGPAARQAALDDASARSSGVVSDRDDPRDGRARGGEGGASASGDDAESVDTAAAEAAAAAAAAAAEAAALAAAEEAAERARLASELARSRWHDAYHKVLARARIVAAFGAAMAAPRAIAWRVTIVGLRATHLPAGDVSVFGRGSSDPYCVLDIQTHPSCGAWRTCTVMKTLNAAWCVQGCPNDLTVAPPGHVLKLAPLHEGAVFAKDHAAAMGNMPPEMPPRSQAFSMFYDGLTPFVFEGRGPRDASEDTTTGRNDAATIAVRIRVFDYDRVGSDDYLGMQVLRLPFPPPPTRTTNHIDIARLSLRPTGKLLVGYRYSVVS